MSREPLLQRTIEDWDQYLVRDWKLSPDSVLKFKGVVLDVTDGKFPCARRPHGSWHDSYIKSLQCEGLVPIQGVYGMEEKPRCPRCLTVYHVRELADGTKVAIYKFEEAPNLQQYEDELYNHRKMREMLWG